MMVWGSGSDGPLTFIPQPHLCAWLKGPESSESSAVTCIVGAFMLPQEIDWDVLNYAVLHHRQGCGLTHELSCAASPRAP